MWHVTPDIWHLTRDMWHVTLGGGWIFSQNVSSLALIVWEWRCPEDLEEKDQSLNHLITKVLVEQPWLHRVCKLWMLSFPNYCLIEFLPPLWNNNGCLRVSFSEAAIVISILEKIFHEKLLGRTTLTFFFGQRFGCLEDEQKPVLVLVHPLLKIRRKLPCTKTGIF